MMQRAIASRDSAIGAYLDGSRRLCSEVDAKDTPFVTLAMHVDGELWTGDAELQAGLRIKGFDRFFVP